MTHDNVIGFPSACQCRATLPEDPMLDSTDTHFNTCFSILMQLQRYINEASPDDTTIELAHQMKHQLIARIQRYVDDLTE